jgi:hypothetical protein
VLFLSCIPSSAPTGFENPAPDVTINSIQTPNASGHFSVIDDSSVAREDRKRHLDFCLYGKKSKFCGSAETILPKNEEPAYITQPIFNFLKTLIFLDGRK